jgi:hypothetical protein
MVPMSPMINARLKTLQGVACGLVFLSKPISIFTKDVSLANLKNNYTIEADFSRKKRHPVSLPLRNTPLTYNRGASRVSRQIALIVFD